MTPPVQIALNGFVKRTQNTDLLKAGIKSSGAKLARKGRSRNWTLVANHEQIRQVIHLINQSGDISWLWVAKVLRDNKPPMLYSELLEMAKQNPSMTVTQLVSLTDCKISEARKVLDEIEWQ